MYDQLPKSTTKHTANDDEDVHADGDNDGDDGMVMPIMMLMCVSLRSFTYVSDHVGTCVHVMYNV